LNKLISVILPVYNGEDFLDEAINSILNQIYRNFELIIINDSSTDSSESIILKYADIDKRIVPIRNESNKGLIFSLNKALTKAKGKYIARMDQDDISLPDRLKIQYNYLSLHHDIDLCGSWIQVFSKDINYIHKYPVEDKEIKSKFLFENPIAHPSVMFRKKSIKKYKNYKDIEDYATWLLNSHRLKYHNIDRVLLNYRYHESNTCKRDNSQKESIEKVINVFNKFFKVNYNIPKVYSKIFLKQEKYFSKDELRSIEVFFLNNINKFIDNHFIYSEILNNILKVYARNISLLSFLSLKLIIKLIYLKIKTY